MYEYKVRSSCAICNNEQLFNIMNYGSVPLAGDFPSKEELYENKKYNLNILFCENCGLVQTDSVINPDKLFKDYRYMSSIGLDKHFKEVAKLIKEKFNPKNILEIGSNDGVLLKPLLDLGLNAIGVDPAKNICEVATSKGCNVYNDYFSEKFVEKNNLYNYFDFIVCNNCFAHIDDIQSIVGGVKKALKKDGYFQVEVHYLKPLIDKLQYDNIYHEHIYYYSLTALNNLFKDNNLTIVDFEELNIHAGSIRVLVKNSTENLPKKVLDRLDLEKYVWGITSVEYFIEFNKKVQEHINKIKDTLQALKLENKKIIGYGASGRANMICNLASITSNIVDYIIDESPERMNRYTSGSHIPIVDKNFFDQDINKPDYIIIFAWNYSKTIIEKLKNRGFKFIVAFPDIKIVSKYEELEGVVSI